MKKILLAEDNEVNRDMLARRLTRRGYEVLLAENGEQAIQQVYKNAPDLVLMDLNMPTLNGWDATAKLREDERGQDVPIIALTAYVMREDWERALDMGCDAVLTKPFRFAELLEEVERWLESGRKDTGA
jgi:CheY-like chemotaxis protein